MNGLLLSLRRAPRGLPPRPLAGLVRPHYGLAVARLGRLGAGRGLSGRGLGRRAWAQLQGLLRRRGGGLGRLLRLRLAKRMEELRKQSSWRSLRLRQGLPVRGQRTHGNSRNAKRLNPARGKTPNPLPVAVPTRLARRPGSGSGSGAAQRR